MSGVALDKLIRAMLLKQPYNQPRLGREAKRFARKLSNRFGRDLPEDIHGEVATEAIVQLLADGPAKLANHSGLRLFGIAVMEAIRVVRASYVQPGVATRRPSRNAPPPAPRRVAAEDIGRVADPRTVERCMVGEDEVRFLDLDRIASPPAAAAMQNMLNRIDVERSLERAPAEIASALRLVFFDGEAKKDVAKAMKLTRFALDRRFRAVGDMWQLAA
jgi:DNA-directed RNA polymerase specialized sigma24 family protein